MRTPRLTSNKAPIATAHHGRLLCGGRAGTSASDGPTLRWRSFSDFFNASRMKLMTTLRPWLRTPLATVHLQDLPTYPARSASARPRCHRHASDTGAESLQPCELVRHRTHRWMTHSADRAPCSAY